MTNSDRINQFYDENDPFTKWQMEKEHREEGKSRLKLG
jgi:hypothetical protein